MLNQLLQKMGFYPTSQNIKHTKYKSPFNPTEKTPSFFTFQGTNGTNWKDYASGEGGDIYKFLMLFHKITFIEAKKILEDMGTIQTVSKNYKEAQKSNTPFSFNQGKSYKILKIDKLQNPVLMNYLKKRGITTYLNVQEVHYELNNKSYFAICFINNSGGLEIRNEYFKGSFGQKDVTSFLPMKKKYNLKVFEGFIDYLSYLEIAKTAPRSDYLILNSVSMLEKAKGVLNRGYELIELYLDNDDAGDKTTQKIKEIIKGIKVIDKRDVYAGYKDLNEYLLSRKRSNQCE